MTSVLGIDAAWTTHNQSGVALAVREAGGTWLLFALASSYREFLGSGPEPAAADLPKRILLRAKELTGALPDMIAVDMPLSLDPITGRRLADRLVSSAYGAKGAATHSASAVRPGRISDEFRHGLTAFGYLLRTPLGDGRLAEVYPHPALIEYAGSTRRLPYKCGKTRSYWPDATADERRARLLSEWERIGKLLDMRINGAAHALELPQASRALSAKDFEDRLDAVVCAAVAIDILEGRARAFGDERAAMWIPRGN